MLETEKVLFKNEKTKKLKTVPFGETLMFSKSGSTESKFTQVDLIITSLGHFTFLLNRQWFRINQVINPEPRTFEGVKGYIANNGANITPGFYRNYHYNTDNTNDNVHIHQVWPKADMYSAAEFPPIGSLQKLKKWSRWLYNILKFLSLLDSGPRLVESFLVGPTEKTNIVGFRPSSWLLKIFGIQMLAGCCLLDLAYYFVFASYHYLYYVNIIVDQSKPKSTFHWSI